AAGCPVNGLEGEEDEEDYLTLSDQESYSSSSATHSYHPSNASSTSDELFEARGRFGPLRRTNSDHIPNGGNLHLQRKMSDPHISRGTYVSPLGSLQSPPNVRLKDADQRRDEATEVIRCVLGRGTSPRAVLDGKGALASKAGQGQPFHQYVSRTPACPGQGRGGVHARDTRKTQDSANTRRTEPVPKNPPQPPAPRHTGKAKVSVPPGTCSPATSRKASAEQPASPCPP
ncbi:family with sequence similarity 83 member G, partial [Chelydra serpentina]